MRTWGILLPKEVMKKISKEVIDVKNVNVNACLHPHPLMPDSYADIEVEWFSWMPGFDSRDLGDDDEEPLFRDNNILLYDKIEEIAVDRFNIALVNVWPLLDSYLINSLHISIDITGMLCSSSTLAAYNYVDSNPQKGNYTYPKKQGIWLSQHESSLLTWCGLVIEDKFL